jgi:hypothetical protein
MGDGIEQWLPNAIQATTAVGQLLLGVGERRWKQAQEWGEQVEHLTSLDATALRLAVEGDPDAAELVGRALEAAVRTASEDKRYLLAKVAAAALRRDATLEQVDALQLLLRTLIALDPPHVTLLVLIGKRVDRSDPIPEGPTVGEDVLTREWPSSSDLLAPALTALEREGLIEPTRETVNGVRYWRLLDYGTRFLDHLLVDAGGWPPRQ